MKEKPESLDLEELSVCRIISLGMGDRILGHLQEEGRYFGMSINERISEK